MEFKKTEKNKVRRGHKKASYDKEIVYSVLDSCEICNIAFSIDGFPYVQPINFGRNGNKLYLHGSLKNRMTNALIDAKEVCLSVMHLDSMKLSRSAFHHSVNYRSVVVFGKVQELTSEAGKLLGLKSIINHFVPNRWDYCRVPNSKELKATRVLEIEIETASAKIANADVTDNKEDKELDFWAGQIPIKTVCNFPVPVDDLKDGVEIPEHVLAFYESNKNGF